MEPEMRPFPRGWTTVRFGVGMAITRICTKKVPETGFTQSRGCNQKGRVVPGILCGLSGDKRRCSPNIAVLLEGVDKN